VSGWHEFIPGNFIYNCQHPRNSSGTNLNVGAQQRRPKGECHEGTNISLVTLSTIANIPAIRLERI
jgi:hypothetical protein